MSSTITAIEPQARHADRFSLYLDQHFALGLSASVAASLHVGQQLTDEELAGLERQEALEAAHEKALRFLEPRPRSTSEVKQHLLKKKVAADIAEQEIARLLEAGLVDDQAFARFWVENREEFRPRAARALRFELKRKGLPDDTIREVIGSVDESESAFRAGWARAQRWRELEHREFRDKLGAFLLRRGFSYETARQAAERLWEAARDENPLPPGEGGPS